MQFLGIRTIAIAAVAAGFILDNSITTPAQDTAAIDLRVAAKGAWDAGTTYAKDDIVTARGSSWISLRANNLNKVPGQTAPSTAAYWQLFARGFNPTGAWSNVTKYQPDDLVTLGGQTYRAKQTNTNKQTNNTTYWELLAAKGAAGPNTVADGTVSAPSIRFTGDSNTGIYSPGADKIALVEGGALFLHNIGTNNTALGLSALGANIDGGANTALGASALGSNTGGDNNTALGFSALGSNTTGNANTGVGKAALASNTTGGLNTAVGLNALSANTTGATNVAVGYQALNVNTIGTNNTALGASALSSNTADSNTAVGVSSLGSTTTGDSNVAVGFLALSGNTTGIRNVGIGSSALAANTTGQFNTAVGDQALTLNTSGFNTAVGAGALGDNTSGQSNVAVGNNALLSNTNGNSNVAVGASALGNLAAGSSNIGVGFTAGVLATNSTSSIFIGNDGAAPDTTTIKIGTQGTQATAFMAGIAGVTVANNAAVLINTTTGQLGTVASSRRYKEDIAPMPDMSEMLARLRPVTFHYRPAHDDGRRELQYGLIAEEVADVLPYLTVFNKDGQPETVKYHLLPTFLLAGWQAQQQTIAAQAEKIEALEARLTRLEAALPQVKAAALR